MYKIILVTVAVVAVSGSEEDPQVDKVDKQLEGLQQELRALSSERNALRQKGQLASIINVGIGAAGTPPLVLGQWIQSNIAQANQIYSDLLGELSQAAPNAGLNGKPPLASQSVGNVVGNVVGKRILNKANKVSKSFIKASETAKSILDEFLADP